MKKGIVWFTSISGLCSFDGKEAIITMKIILLTKDGIWFIALPDDGNDLFVGSGIAKLRIINF